MLLIALKTIAVLFHLIKTLAILLKAIALFKVTHEWIQSD